MLREGCGVEGRRFVLVLIREQPFEGKFRRLSRRCCLSHCVRPHPTDLSRFALYFLLFFCENSGDRARQGRTKR